MKQISGKDFCKALERDGWELARINGSHHIYKKEGQEAILTVPVHGNEDLKKGLLQSLLKLTGLTEEDF